MSITKRPLGDGLLGKLRKTAMKDGAKGLPPSLVGADLEQAYRTLLLENQVLIESNQRLHERLARAEDGLTESPAASRLMRTQRDALAESSRKLREVQYENQDLRRRHKKLQEDSRRLATALSRRTAELPDLKAQLKSKAQEAEALRQQLAKVKGELAMLTDRYYQLQARFDPVLSADRVIKADFWPG